MCNLTLHYIPVSNFTHRQKADIVSPYASHYCAWCLTCTPCVSAAILSALRNLQEKIRRLEREKWQAELNLHSIRRDVSHAHLQSDKVTQTPLNDPTNMEQETSGLPNCNQGACASNRLCAGIIVGILFLMWCILIQHWSPPWPLQSLAVRSWSGSWTSWGGSWPVRLMRVPVVLHADTFLHNQNKRCECCSRFRQTYEWMCKRIRLRFYLSRKCTCVGVQRRRK